MSKSKKAAKEIPCPHCGALNAADYSFCFHCKHTPAQAKKAGKPKKSGAKKAKKAKK